jgi:hypothetical protein
LRVLRLRCTTEESNGPRAINLPGLAMLGSASFVFVVRCGALFGALVLIVLAVGGGVAAGRATGSGAGAVFVVSAAGGSARQLAPVPALALSPDQNAAIAADAQPDGTVSLVVRELGSGAEQTIFVTPPGQDPAAPLGFGEAVWPNPGACRLRLAGRLVWLTPRSASDSLSLRVLSRREHACSPTGGSTPATTSLATSFSPSARAMSPTSTSSPAH